MKCPNCGYQTSALRRPDYRAHDTIGWRIRSSPSFHLAVYKDLKENRYYQFRWVNPGIGGGAQATQWIEADQAEKLIGER